MKVISIFLIYSTTQLIQSKEIVLKKTFGTKKITSQSLIKMLKYIVNYLNKTS